MPKKGKPDSYWEGLMRQYARGEYHFGTGQTPGSNKWKAVLRAISECPRHKKTNTADLFGNQIVCKCGYHKTTAQPGSSMSRPTTSGPTTSGPTTSGPTTSGPTTSGPTTSGPTTSGPTTSGPTTSGPRVSGPIVPTVITLEPVTSGPPKPGPATSSQSTDANDPTEKCIECSQCTTEVAVSQFSIHLSAYHAKVTCEHCNKVSTGSIAHEKHMKDMHPHELPSVHHLPSKSRNVNQSQFTPRSGSGHHQISTTPTLTSPSISPVTSSLSTGFIPYRKTTIPTSPLQTSTRQTPSLTLPSVAALKPTPSTGFIPYRRTTVTTTPTSPMQTSTTQTPSLTSPPVAPLNPTPSTGFIPYCRTTVTTTPTSPRQTSTTQTPSLTPASVTPVISQSTTRLTPHQRTTPPSSSPSSLSGSSLLPRQFTTVIQPGDIQWISHVLYESNGRFRAKFSHNWYEPPPPPKATVSPPDPHCYFRQRLFLWAPMRMWGIPLNCPECNIRLTHGGIYPKAREVIDVNCRYYMVGEYVRCSKCKQPHCPWNAELLNQLDPAHRVQFPAVLTQQLALDKKVVSLMKPRTMGNSSNFLRQAVAELHSEEWGKRVLQYFGDCELHKRGCVLTGASPQYQPPPAYRPPPLAALFETAHTNDVAGHIDQMKGVVTSTFGSILKLDSTKKITTKLAGNIEGSATWMSNVGNQRGEILNSVLTTGEGAGLQKMCQGIVKRYLDAGEKPPELIYVYRDCCSESGDIPVMKWFKPWKCHVRLDIWHFMRRFNSGLTTEHHPLYGTWCQRLSSCIFVWDRGDLSRLKAAKNSELHDSLGHEPTDQQVTSGLKAAELARHCRRTTRGAEETRQLISKLIQEMGNLTDTMGTPLINPETMPHVWRIQQKHVVCIQDVPGVILYTKTGTLQKGNHTLPIFRCGRGSTSLESFHRHQCSFIPGYRCNALHTQMYLLEGLSRWNMNRGQQAVDARSSSGTALYDLRLVANINDLSLRLLDTKLLPEYPSYGKPTGEEIAVEYLLSQSGKGDLHPAPHQTEAAPLDVQEEVDSEEEVDETVSTLTEPPSFAALTEARPSSPEHIPPEDIPPEDITMPPPLSPSSSPSPPSPPPPLAQESRQDVRGNPGWEAVDDLAGYLLRLNRDKTALTTREAASIVRLYNSLHSSDRSPTKFSVKSNQKQPTGRWRVSRKPSGSAPGRQASERLYVVHGQAAESPDRNRVSECLCLRLFKEFQLTRNRPIDVKGNRLPLPQAIVQAYSHIRQLVQDDAFIQANAPNLVLVTINNATTSSWLKRREKRVGTATLLQSADLPAHFTVAEEPLPTALDQPSSPAAHGHNPLEFTEPTNMEGEVAPRRKRKAPTSHQSSSSTSTPQWSPPPMSTYQYGWPAWCNQPVMMMPPWFQPPPWFQTSQSQSTNQLPPWVQPPNFESQTQSTPSGPPHSDTPTSSPSAQPDRRLSEQPSISSHVPQWAKPPAWSQQPPSETTLPGFEHSSMAQPFSETPTQVHPLTRPQPPAQPSPSSRNREWRLAMAAQQDAERRARGEQPTKRYRKREVTVYKCTLCGKEKKGETGHTQLDGKWFCPSSEETLDQWRARIYKCPECKGIRNKENGHIRHPKSRNSWYCPSSGETVEQWKQRIG